MYQAYLKERGVGEGVKERKVDYRVERSKRKGKEEGKGEREKRSAVE